MSVEDKDSLVAPDLHSGINTDFVRGCKYFRAATPLATKRIVFNFRNEKYREDAYTSNALADSSCAARVMTTRRPVNNLVLIPGKTMLLSNLKVLTSDVCLDLLQPGEPT